MIRLSKLLESEMGERSSPPKDSNMYDNSDEQAKQIYDQLGYDFDIKEFCDGMRVEMEHKDVTGGDLEKTAKITAAHLKEVPNYYTLLKKYVEK